MTMLSFAVSLAARRYVRAWTDYHLARDRDEHQHAVALHKAAGELVGLACVATGTPGIAHRLTLDGRLVPCRVEARA